LIIHERINLIAHSAECEMSKKNCSVASRVMNGQIIATLHS